MSEPGGLEATQAANLAVTQKAFAAFRPEAIEELLSLADPEVEIFASHDLANSGSFSGHEGFMTWMSQWMEAWDDYELNIQKMEAVGERHVVTSVKQSATGRGSGIPVEMDVAFMNELDGERYVALHLYPSRDEAVAVAKQREADRHD
jgi:ketosteroid isomerase-like protein